MPEKYDTAQVCQNGHIITDSIQVNPKINQKFCDKCGTSLITECPHCNASIRGRKYIPDVYAKYRVINLYDVSKYCYQCGKPYPWLQTKLEAARELTHLIENITSEDIDILTNSIDDIVNDTPKTEVAAIKFKHIIQKYSKSFLDTFRNILIDVASDTAKKIIWPN